MDARNLRLDLVVAPRPRWSPLRIGNAGGVFVVRGRGDRQLAADRLDTQFITSAATAMATPPVARMPAAVASAASALTSTQVISPPWLRRVPPSACQSHCPRP